MNPEVAGGGYIKVITFTLLQIIPLAIGDCTVIRACFFSAEQGRVVGMSCGSHKIWDLILKHHKLEEAWHWDAGVGHEVRVFGMVAKWRMQGVLVKNQAAMADSPVEDCLARGKGT